MKNHNWYIVLAIISSIFYPIGIIFTLLFLLMWSDKEEEKEWENYKKSIDNNSKVWYNIDNEREVITMKIKLILTKNEKVMMWVNEGYECLPKYDKVYGWWCDDKITDEVWNEFCFMCLQEIMMINRNVLERMKNEWE